MPKSKQMALAAAPVDSSDSDEEPPAADGGKKKAFDKDRVIKAVLGRQAPGANPGAQKGCADHLPTFFKPEVTSSWLRWAAATPSKLEEVPEQHRLRTCKMPMKCLPAGEQQVEQQRVQREIIRYQNADGRQVNATMLVRDSDARKALVEGDVLVGSTVALAREAIDATASLPGGYGTPFYIGDVRSIEYEAGTEDCCAIVASAGASSSHAAATPRRIASMGIHYRMPRLRFDFVDDVQRPWVLACHGKHEWTSACVHRTGCLAVAAANGQDTAAVMHQADVQELLEAGIELLSSGALAKKSKERLAEHGPPDGEWRALLGLPEAGAAQSRPSKKVRR